ncbi:hypothetical protein BH09ACT6_BH09ACT6_06170 [soil metagenome]
MASPNTGPDGDPGDASASGRDGSRGPEHSGDAQQVADQEAAAEREKRKRLVAARLVVAGVGLTFLIVGFVQFLTR